MNRIGKFFRGRFTPLKSVSLAIAFGVFSPILMGFLMLFRMLHPWLFIIVAIIFVFFLYWRTGKGLFRKDIACLLQSTGAGCIFVVGFAGSVWCYMHHVCMGGHMAHGPYPLWHYLADVAWASSVLLATFWLTRIRSPICICSAFFAAFVISYRFVFESGGGGWFPIPI